LDTISFTEGICDEKTDVIQDHFGDGTKAMIEQNDSFQVIESIHDSNTEQKKGGDNIYILSMVTTAVTWLHTDESSMFL